MDLGYIGETQIPHVHDKNHGDKTKPNVHYRVGTKKIKPEEMEWETKEQTTKYAQLVTEVQVKIDVIFDDFYAFENEV